MIKRALFSLSCFTSLIFADEISSFTAIKYKADFSKQEHKTQQAIVNEYSSLKKLAKTIEAKDLKGDADFEVSKNLLLIDIWSKKFLQSYIPTNEELQKLYLEQKPSVVAKYELRNILVSYEKNADMILEKLNLINNQKEKKDSFIKYVKSVSNDNISKNNQGLSPIVDENRLNPQIKEALAGKKEGDIIKVNVKDLGTQIIYIEKYIPQKEASFEESKDALTELAKKIALNRQIELLSK
ncbi:peptidylprolyl isomerase [Arcobacter vandammei]|uniref:peptidylprolyl isomerase n=1 Tax=Arcobacter vandammei TaxID=2782243 RepID=UPI0018DF7512|nr:peptidylprolyl isomerase [Arcobacter vandammei]